MTTEAHLRELLDGLVARGELALADWPGELGSPEDLGLLSSGDRITLRPNSELLSPASISAQLTASAATWLRHLEVHRVIGSTNDRVMALAESRSIDGVVCLAELQTKGRGRRGRTWLSPFAGNLALSVGVGLARELHELGGLSLAAGLAVIDCLGTLGVEHLALKWPNDVLLAERKLGGILVELRKGPWSRSRVEVVVGIGLNVDVPTRVQHVIDQPIVDLRGEGYQVSRNQLAAALMSSIVDYVKEFEKVGFAPMRHLFNEHHLFHRKACELTQGATIVAGQVVGVTETGEILLETESGIGAFGAGEVSLRQQS